MGISDDFDILKDMVTPHTKICMRDSRRSRGVALRTSKLNSLVILVVGEKPYIYNKICVAP